ncbi:MAG: retroviral-like aspartic protease family protein [Chroococcidiopsidaceae cyanobacterium CP_BM_ER_R8_30]|nr:retroviral-like aspartic protease family protein [Chroococcidiopsidaceae cyanobacterium CP_BM_ER_R8_30]
MPIKRHQHGVPIIDVTFNGTQTFEMLVDTGASSIVLTPQVAAAVGFVPVGTVKINSATDRGVETVLGHVASVGVAGAVIKNPEVAVAPALDMGLLGENFFKDYDVTVREKVIEFRTRPQQ